jgi:hypothetical protein
MYKTPEGSDQTRKSERAATVHLQAKGRDPHAIESCVGIPTVGIAWKANRGACAVRE